MRMTKQPFRKVTIDPDDMPDFYSYPFLPPIDSVAYQDFANAKEHDARLPAERHPSPFPRLLHRALDDMEKDGL